jgi:hypothetical protein
MLKHTSVAAIVKVAGLAKQTQAKVLDPGSRPVYKDACKSIRL